MGLLPLQSLGADCSSQCLGIDTTLTLSIPSMPTIPAQVLQSAKGLIHVKYLRLSSFWPAVTIVTASTQSNKGVQAKAPTKYITNL